MVRSRHGLAATAVAILAVAALTGCASSASRSRGAATTSTSAATTTVPPPSSTTPSSSPATTSPPAATTDVRVYFLRGGRIDVAHRAVAPTPRIATAAMTQLLSGTTPADTSAGMVTSVPAGTRLLGVSVAGGTATVDLSASFASGADPASISGRLAQVTYTLTQFPTVSRVAFRVGGQALSTLGGVSLAQPLSRPTFPELAPAALLEFPGRGWTVHSPIRLAGTAAVFEGQFSAELTDGAGRVIATRAMYAPLTTAIGGPFDTELAYPAGVSGPAVLTLFDMSMKDGSRVDLVSIPVDLAG